MLTILSLYRIIHSSTKQTNGNKNMKKYELTVRFIRHEGAVLRRIRALKDFSGVKSGDLGGFVESESNLSLNGNCWIYPLAKAMGNSQVIENAVARDNSTIKDNAIIKGNVILAGNSTVSGEAVVGGGVTVEDSVIDGARVIHENIKLKSSSIRTSKSTSNQ